MDDANDHLREESLESTQVFRGKLLDVRCDRVRLPDGEERLREYVKHQGAAVVIAVLDDGHLLFVRQHRYPLHRSFIELPAGKIDPGEEILDTAARELREETGHRAADWRHLGTMHPCVGYSDERIEIFLARALHRESAPHPDQGEFLDLLSLSLDEALAAVRSGAITDAKTVTGLFWAEKVVRAGW
ncbi:MAG: NUDIX hydrolase [Candidatus Accumulibacter phosphatis]|uniref:NUDIX domain-containing protein n=1 Tax=Candidatus Accumulibacter phosphatis TaxID=327160 RepID=UPI001A55D2F0|nr:NUDIX hydrolase [Candidatus Accumulibacter phosphatis]